MSIYTHTYIHTCMCIRLHICSFIVYRGVTLFLAIWKIYTYLFTYTYMHKPARVYICSCVCPFTLKYTCILCIDTIIYYA